MSDGNSHYRRGNGEPRVRFEPTVSLGQVLSLLVLLSGLVGAVRSFEHTVDSAITALDKRIASLEQTREEQRRFWETRPTQPH